MKTLVSWFTRTTIGAAPPSVVYLLQSHLFWSIISVSSYRQLSFSRLASWHFSFLWAEGAGGFLRPKLTPPQNHTPIHQMNSCGQEGVHYTMAFTLSMITSRPLEAWRGVVVIFYFFWRKQVTRKTTGGLVQVFFPLHCVCHAASGELQHSWASWKWLQGLFFFFFLPKHCM